MMRPLSPSPMTCGIRQRLLMSGDAFGTEDSSSRSSSLPPRARVAFSGINTLAPCSKEFQKSLNDLNQRDEDTASAANKLTLPVIQLLKNSETNHVGRDGSHGKPRASCWDDDSTTSGNSTSDDDITTSWTSLSNVGKLVTLRPKKWHRGMKTKSDNSDGETYDDSMSVRSDSYMICKNSPSVHRKTRGRKRGDSPPTTDDDTGRLSRKDDNTRRRKTYLGLEPPVSNNRPRGLSPLSRPQQEKDKSFRQPIHRSKSAHTSPQQERREIHLPSTRSTPSSPYGSPLLNRASNAKRATEIPKWQIPFNLYTSPSSSSFTSQNINPILVHKDASRSYRLSDFCATKHSHSVANLEEEFKRLKSCRYLRRQSDEIGSDEEYSPKVK